MPQSKTSEDSYQLSYIPDSPQYVIRLYSGINIEQSYSGLIKSGRGDVSPSQSYNNATTLEGIPHLLRHDSKVTMDHKGAFHKG